MMIMRTIKVTGKGQSRVRPDTTRVKIILKGVYQKYEETLRHSAQDTAKLRDLLVQLGFKETDLKTPYFYFNTKFNEVKVGNTFKKQFAGYQYYHEMKVEFSFDNDRLGRIMQALAASSLNPEFNINYLVSNPETVKTELLEKAVCDAAKKAEVLSSAAKVRLREIQSIDCSWEELNFEISPINSGCLAESRDGSNCGGYDLGIEPDDIELHNTVTVIWEIE